MFPSKVQRGTGIECQDLHPGQLWEKPSSLGLSFISTPFGLRETGNLTQPGELAYASVDPSRIDNKEMSQAVALHLLEEATEVCLSLGIDPLEVQTSFSANMIRQIKKGSFGTFDSRAAATELSDTFITTCRVAAHLDIDLEIESDGRHRFNTLSNWNVKPNGDFRRIKR